MEICTTTLFWIDSRLYRQKIYTDTVYTYIYIKGILFSFGCQGAMAWINEYNKKMSMSLSIQFLISNK